MKTATVRKSKTITIGLDLGGRRHTYCVLEPRGEILKQGRMVSSRGQLEAMARCYPGTTVIMEAGMQSPWVSRSLEGLGMKAANTGGTPRHKIVKEL